MTLKNIFTNYKNLIAFMVLCIFIQMILGDKVLTSFLWVVLLSMILINGDEFISFMQKF